jgi:WD40 repeat protein
MVAFSPDGGVLAAASLEGTVALWDLTRAEPRPLTERKKPGEQFASVAWRADGRGLAAGTKRGSVYLWDMGRMPPAEEKRPASPGVIPAVTFAVQGEMLVAGGRTLELWGWPGADYPRTLADEPGVEVRELRFSPDCRLLAVGLATGEIRLWHLDGADPVRGRLLKHHTNSVVSVSFSPDGRLLATAGDRRVVLWDASTRELLREWQVPGHCLGHIAFAPDSRYLVLGSDNDVLVLRLEAPPR